MIIRKTDIKRSLRDPVVGKYIVKKSGAPGLISESRPVDSFILSPNAPVVPKVRDDKHASSSIIRIRLLETRRLKEPLDIIIEPDGPDYLATSPDLSVYGFGESVGDAVDMLKREIESLHSDLSSQNDLNEKWSAVRDFLSEIIVPS